MNIRNSGYIPRDLALLLLPTLFFAAAAMGLGFLIVLANTPHSASAPLAAGFAVALMAAGLGVTLLLRAKLPQLRRGVLFRFGCSTESEIHRRLYRQAYLLIVPACLALVVLILVALNHP